MFLDGTFGASVAITETQAEKDWDSTTMKYVPYGLRGLKPVTNEPWARCVLRSRGKAFESLGRPSSIRHPPLMRHPPHPSAPARALSALEP